MHQAKSNVMKNLKLAVVTVIIAVSVMPFVVYTQQQSKNQTLDVNELQRLIKELDDDDPKVRREAHKKLKVLAWKHRGKVIQMLEKELARTESLEVKSRIKELLSEFYAGKWEQEPLPRPPIKGRSGHTAVWTGEKMIVWGGRVKRRCNDGAIFELLPMIK